ncbi:MAG: putative C-S lyase [Chloroflexi bacterium]|nr:putative C-S lyase [Chloroflexota bacterium]
MGSVFDCYIDRAGTDSAKWHVYGDGVIPLWVADMDFRSPESVIDALRSRVEHGIFGYGIEPPSLRDVLTSRLKARYGWQVAAEDLVFIPGVVVGFNLAAQAVCQPGESLLLQTPIYYPMLSVAERAGLTMDQMELTRESDGRYTVDLDRMEHAVQRTTRMFLMCNPHNPVGRAFSRQELEGMADLALRHRLVICSDEIHCELVLPEYEHIPIASLDAEVAARTITLMAPSKTYNIAGLKFSVAIIQNPALRDAFVAAYRGVVAGISVLSYAAALAAYEHGDPWLSELLSYLEGNRAFLAAFVRDHLPGVRMTPMEATYLAWLDCRDAQLPARPAEFFLDKARVALNAGESFGPGGEGYVRLNYGCCRELLATAAERMADALQR